MKLHLCQSPRQSRCPDPPSQGLQMSALTLAENVAAFYTTLFYDAVLINATKSHDYSYIFRFEKSHYDSLKLLHETPS